MKKIFTLFFLLPALLAAQTNVQKDGNAVVRNGPVRFGSGNTLDILSGGNFTLESGSHFNGFVPSFLPVSGVTAGAYTNADITVDQYGRVTLAANGSGTGGSGTVTTITVSNLAPLFTASVTNPTTTPAVTFTLSNASPNQFFAGPASGGAAPWAARALVVADIPSLTLSKISDAGNSASRNVGTTAGTVAAGDDSRIVSALQPSGNLAGLASPSTALTNLGASIVGKSLFTAANPSAVSYIQVNVDNTITYLSAAQLRTALSLGGAALLNVGTTAGTVAAGDDSRILGAAQKAANLSDLASASTARSNLGLGGAAVLNVGTTTGTVAAGDDSRILGAAQKAANLSDLASASTARTNLGLGTLATQNGTFSGTSSGTNTGDQNIWRNFIVAGQTSLTPTSTTTDITMVAGSGIVLTTDNAAKSLTISATGAGSGNVTGSGLISGNIVVGAGSNAIASSNISISGNDLTVPGNLTVGANATYANVTVTGAFDVSGATFTGNLPVVNIGSGFTNGQTLIGNTTSGKLVAATITAGTGIAITNGASSITINATNVGTVTVSGSPTSGQIAEWTSGFNVQGKATTGSGNIVEATSPTITTPTFSGITIGDGASVSTATSITSNVINVAKVLNTDAITANTTYTFSGTPANTNQFFSAFIAATSGNVTATIPSSKSIRQATTITTVPIVGGSALHLTWRYDGTNYWIYGD